ncbi:hypothetical protein AVEN_39670-1, partial [Araneus ventricosus]
MSCHYSVDPEIFRYPSARQCSSLDFLVYSLIKVSSPCLVPGQVLGHKAETAEFYYAESGTTASRAEKMTTHRNR